MALREKFGRLVLLEETESSALGREYRAARLGPAGLDRLVSVLRFAAPISQDAEATKRLMDEARLAARLSNPGLQRVLGIGRVDQSFYVSAELVEGRTLASVVDRCARESFPFAVDHALMVASRAASALEYLHGKKDDAGAPFFHGLVSPRRLIVAFDGEVKLTGLGLWPALRGTALLPEDERAYLAPEQASGGAGDARSDVFSLARVLLSSLTLGPPDGKDPLAAVAEARVVSPSGESGPVPKPLADLLRRSLAPEPAARFASVAEMRKVIDTLLFSGDFTPTTFDLAFFMHTLFREEMDAEARTLEEDRHADYREFLAEEKTAAAALPSDAPPAVAVASVPGAPEPPPTLAESSRATVEQRPAAAPAALEPAAEPAPVRDTRSREAAAREAASRLSLGAAEPAKGGSLKWVVLAAVLALAAAGGWYVMSRRSSTPPPAAAPAALSAEAQAAMDRVKELESRIAQLEGEKAAAEAKAAEDAKKKLEAQAAAKGRTVDPQALERAQEEARQRARAEEEARQREEMRRIAEARRAEEKRIAEATPPPPAPAPTPTPEPAAEATPATVTASPGVVTPTPATAAPAAVPAAAPEPRVVPPAVVAQSQIVYPSFAREHRIEGTVEVSALVDETGRVAEANVVRSQPRRQDFEDAALKHVRGRKYRPATRDDVPVRVWVSVVVEFKLKR